MTVDDTLRRDQSNPGEDLRKLQSNTQRAALRLLCDTLKLDLDLCESERVAVAVALEALAHRRQTLTSVAYLAEGIAGLLRGYQGIETPGVDATK